MVYEVNIKFNNDKEVYLLFGPFVYALIYDRLTELYFLETNSYLGNDLRIRDEEFESIEDGMNFIFREINDFIKNEVWK